MGKGSFRENGGRTAASSVETDESEIMQTPLIWRQALIHNRTIDLTSLIPQELLISRQCVVFRQTGRIPIQAPRYFDKPTVRQVVGSIRYMRIEHVRLTGTLCWASDEQARDVQRAFESGELVPRLEYFALERMDSGRPGLELITRWQPVAIQLRRKDGLA